MLIIFILFKFLSTRLSLLFIFFSYSIFGLFSRLYFSEVLIIFFNYYLAFKFNYADSEYYIFIFANLKFIIFALFFFPMTQSPFINNWAAIFKYQNWLNIAIKKYNARPALLDKDLN
jgi:hypothetical protein